MQMKAAAIALALIIAVSGAARATMDSGGSVTERMREIDHLNAVGGTFHISGICISACTLYLTLKKVCVEPGAFFGFHQASDDDGKRDAFASAMLLNMYPAPIQAWLNQNHALDNFDPTPMTAETAWSMGIPRCSSAHTGDDQ